MIEASYNSEPFKLDTIKDRFWYRNVSESDNTQILEFIVHFYVPKFLKRLEKIMALNAEMLESLKNNHPKPAEYKKLLYLKTILSDLTSPAKIIQNRHKFEHVAHIALAKMRKGAYDNMYPINVENRIMHSIRVYVIDAAISPDYHKVLTVNATKKVNVMPQEDQNLAYLRLQSTFPSLQQKMEHEGRSQIKRKILNTIYQDTEKEKFDQDVLDTYSELTKEFYNILTKPFDPENDSMYYDEPEKTAVKYPTSNRLDISSADLVQQKITPAKLTIADSKSQASKSEEKENKWITDLVWLNFNMARNYIEGILNQKK